MTKKNRTILIIAIIFLIGSLLRLGNPNYGSPVLYAMSDEASNYMSALYMISQKTLISKAAVYPPLGAYTMIPFLLITFLVLLISKQFGSITELSYFLISHEGYFLFIPRIISGIFGSFTILLVYLISKELFPKSKSIAIWATLFFSLCFNHIHVSHFNRPWSGMVFFYALTILFSLKCITKRNNKYRNCLLSGLFAGLAFGYHYAGLFAISIFLFTILPFNYKKAIKVFLQAKTIIALTIFAVLTIIFNSLIQNKVSSDFFAPAIAFYNNDGILVLFLNLIKGVSIIQLLHQIFTIDPVITFLGLPVLFLPKFWKNPYKGLTLFTVMYLLMSSIFIHTSARYIMPLMLILSIYSAYTITGITSKISSVILKIFTILFILTITLINPLLWNYQYFKKPTFIQLRFWLNQTIDPNIPIASNSYRMIGYSPSIESIKAVQENHPNYYNKLYTILSKNQYSNPDNIRNIYYLEQLGKLDIESINLAIDKHKIRYFIDLYWNPINKLEPMLDPKKFKYIKKFSPVKNNRIEISIYNLTFHILNEENNNFLFYTERPGPYIDVYEIY